MDANLPIVGESKSWPPERGWPLFLAWMGGVVGAAVLGMLIFSAMMQNASSLSFPNRALYMVPVTLGHAWEAWLLFRKHRVRFGLWTLLPLTMLALPASLTVMQYASLVTPLVEAAILRGVRRRAWAWIFAGMAGVIAVQVQGVFYYGWTSRVREMSSSLGLSPMFASVLTVSFARGLFILSHAISAAVLAWKMPPVEAPEPSVKNTSA